MWGLFALRTRHPPPCSSSVYRGSTRGAGEGVEKNSSVTPCQGLCQNECFDASPLRCVRNRTDTVVSYTIGLRC